MRSSPSALTAPKSAGSRPRRCWAGEYEDFTFLGNWGGGPHTVAVNFVNG